MLTVMFAMLFTLASPQGAHAQTAELLGRRSAPSDSAATEPAYKMPDWLANIVGGAMKVQIQLNREMTATLREAKQGNSWWPALSIIALSFAYGVFHAAGPGHGKMVTSTYFLSRDAGWKQGVAMGALIAATQAVSAIALVGILGLVFDLGPAEITRNGLLLELASYALIVVMGGYMCLRIAQGRDDCCDHGPIGHTHNHDHHHNHSHEHHDHHEHDGHSHDGHDHAGHLAEAHSHDHVHEHEHVEPKAAQTGRYNAITSAIIVGLRPCTGSILMLLFTLANGLFLVGIVAAFAMAFGVALTVSAIGLAAIGIRFGSQKLFSLPPVWSDWIRRIVGFGGAALITLFGVILFLSASHHMGWI
ncbi:high frequency lysogenization protein HflD [Thalassospira marina]|uniref:Nickel/cobalt efflux system n=2 Tax=Thalassospira marina TaxID=2048283 RepID=A0A2N3L0J4_9PROT|nr:high frequency lysogenization protein HflD [Thalassospira marina]